MARPCRALACGIIASARRERQVEEANMIAPERLNDVATHCGHCIVERTKLAAVAKTDQRARAPARARAADARDACFLGHPSPSTRARSVAKRARKVTPGRSCRAQNRIVRQRCLILADAPLVERALLGRGACASTQASCATTSREHHQDRPRILQRDVRGLRRRLRTRADWHLAHRRPAAVHRALQAVRAVQLRVVCEAAS